MDIVDPGPNVELRTAADGARIVVLGFPYDAHLVDVVSRIPGRRFDWDRREWFATAEDWVGVHVADIVARFLAGRTRRGHRHHGRGRRCAEHRGQAETPQSEATEV